MDQTPLISFQEKKKITRKDYQLFCIIRGSTFKKNSRQTFLKGSSTFNHCKEASTLAKVHPPPQPLPLDISKNFYYLDMYSAEEHDIVTTDFLSPLIPLFVPYLMGLLFKMAGMEQNFHILLKNATKIVPIQSLTLSIMLSEVQNQEPLSKSSGTS